MKVHFIGVGGIGVSALAQYYLSEGHKVSGSDLAHSEIIDFLRKKGVKITNKASKEADLIIYSPAVSDPPAKAKSYPEALGELTRKYFTIAVSGTHGKSTTAAMISLILTKAGLDPTVIVGVKLKEFNNSNFRKGKSKYLIIEADEWQASFLNYRPKIIVLTNIEREHLDYYKNLAHILKTYKKYVNYLSSAGLLILNGDDKNISKIKFQISKPEFKIQNYSLSEKESSKLRKILKVPGEHNIYNGLAALKTARVLGVSDKIIFQALGEYRGAWRRFEIVKKGKLKIIHDYAHHPTEVEACLKGARQKFPDKKIWCLFQPHQYQRTFYLFSDFIRVFSSCPVDKIIITDIFDVAGREKKDIRKKVSSEKLARAVKGALFLPKSKIKEYLKNNLKGGEILMVMGAGDIYRLF